MNGELTVREFEAQFRELVARQRSQTDNVGSVHCSDCRSCSSCTFCRESERLLRCHYCVRLVSSADCSHCTDGKNLTACHHCTECEDCMSSSYLVRSIGCIGCTYCFGCVGLSNKDFHVLNQPLSRQEYFATTQRLAGELGL